MSLIRNSPYLDKDLEVFGFVFDLQNGQVKRSDWMNRMPFGAQE